MSSLALTPSINAPSTGFSYPHVDITTEQQVKVTTATKSFIIELVQLKSRGYESPLTFKAVVGGLAFVKSKTTTTEQKIIEEELKKILDGKITEEESQNILMERVTNLLNHFLISPENRTGKIAEQLLPRLKNGTVRAQEVIQILITDAHSQEWAINEVLALPIVK